MRNLKRALSLALASVMVLGMMVVGAGAASFDDFSDKDKVVNVEAVSILNNLNVINGKDDGSFDPTGIVTRGEMAKMICVILNGGKDPNLGSSATTSYTDTVGNWAAGYIEFCTNQKIVGGDGTGKFNPTNTVTGQEAAKMLLVAMGYDATYETMTGASWATSVNVLANKNDLYDGLTIDPSVGLTRDDAAQMVYNALNAKMVEYDYAIIPNNGTVTSIANAKVYDDNRTILTDKFGAVKVEGVVTGNEVAKLTESDADASAMDAGKTRIDITNGYSGSGSSRVNGDQDTYGNGNATFSVDTGMAELGRSVTLYVKPYASNKSNTEKATVIGSVIVDEGDKVVVTTGTEKLASLADDNNLDIIYKGETDATKHYTNYAGGTTFTKGDNKNVRGVERTLIDNDGDGEVEYVLDVIYTFGKVTKYATKDDGSITVKVAGGTWSKDKSKDVVGFDDVAKDDYVLAAQLGGKLYVEKAESVTGNLDRFKKDDSLTVDGTAYKISGVGAYDDGDLTSVKPGEYNTTGAEATFFLDKAGYIVAVGDAEENASKYALVIGYDKPSNNIDSERAKVVLSDGTTGTYYVDKLQEYKASDKKWVALDKGDNSDYTTGNDLVGKVVLYSLNSDDEILLRVPNKDTEIEDDASGVYNFSKGKTSLTVDSGTYIANSSTVFFYATLENGEIDDADVYVGNGSAPTVDNASGKATMVVRDGKTVKAVLAVDVSASGAGDYLFLYNYGGSDSDTSVFDAIIDGQLKAGDDAITINRGDLDDNSYDLYEYTITSDNEYKLTEIDNWNADKSSYISGNIVKISGNSIYIDKVDADHEYVLKSGSVVALIDEGDTELDVDLTEGDYVKMVIDDGDIEAAFITTQYDEDDVSATVVDAHKSDVSVDGKKITFKTAIDAGDVDDYISIPAKAEMTVKDADGKTVTSGAIANDYTITVANGDIYCIYTVVIKA